MAKLVIPGSIFSRQDGRSKKLYYKLRLPNQPKNKPVKPIATGLDDTPANRRLAEELKKKKYLDAIGLSEDSDSGPVNITIREAHDEYMDYRALSKSPGTLRNDRDAYKYIVRGNYFLNEKIKRGKIESYSVKEDCDAFIGRKDLEPSTRSIFFRAFKTFVRHCVDEGWMERNPFPSKYKVNVPEAEVDPWTQEESDAIVEGFMAQPHRSSKAKSYLVRFLRHTGYRIHEALEFEKSKQLRKDYIRKKSKDGQREKTFPRTEEIDAIIAGMEKLYPGQDKLFPFTMEGDYSHLNRALNNLLKKLKIPKRGRAFHEFRKLAISKLVFAVVDILMASELMDCSVVVMKKYYVKFDKRQVHEAAKHL